MGFVMLQGEDMLTHRGRHNKTKSSHWKKMRTLMGDYGKLKFPFYYLYGLLRGALLLVNPMMILTIS